METEASTDQQALTQAASAPADSGQSPTPDMIAKVWKLRKDVCANGYKPVAVYSANSGVENPGKQPKGKDWINRALKEPPEAADIAPEPDALNTGILCNGLVPIDSDADDPEIAKSVTKITQDVCGQALIRTRENSHRKRIKSLCGAKPPQKLRWTNAGRLSAIGAMEISPGTLGARADGGGSAFAPWVV